MRDEISAAIQGMRETAVFTDGAVAAKTKCMAAVLIGARIQCEPCIRYYAAKAKEYGATEEEMTEILEVNCALGGCVGEVWGLKALEIFRRG